jgi:hypothetical protein
VIRRVAGAEAASVLPGLLTRGLLTQEPRGVGISGRLVREAAAPLLAGEILPDVHQRFAAALQAEPVVYTAALAHHLLLDPVGELCAREGITLELQDRSEVDGAVKKAFVKTDSIGKIVLLDLPFNRNARKKIRIKLEIDTNPPAGSSFETAYINFPVLSALTTQTLGSGFGTKSHALLCRDYIKGRDWYDLLWYIERGVVPDLRLLQSAIDQHGPWAGEGQWSPRLVPRGLAGAHRDRRLGGREEGRDPLRRGAGPRGRRALER